MCCGEYIMSPFKTMKIGSKKYKLNVKQFRNFILMVIAAMVLVAAICVLTMPVLIELNGEKEVTLCYGEEYVEEGASVKWNLGKVKIKGDVDTSAIGVYKVRYSFLGERLMRTVRVVDGIRPEIKLEGPVTQYYSVGDEYYEYGYSAYDEIDGDVTELVEVDLSELDMSKEGRCHVSYIATDKSGNAVRERREIIVAEYGPLQQSLWDFSLHPYFDDVILREAPFDEEKYAKLWTFGDSFIGNLQYYGGFSWYRTIYYASLNTDNFSSVAVRYPDGFDYFDNIMAREKPETLLVLLNSDWTGQWSVEYLADSCDRAYSYLAKNYPDTRVIICSLTPVDSYFNQGGYGRNYDIDKMNVHMCMLCRKYGFKFMNVAEVLRNPNTGGCYDEYISDDHIHLSRAGFRLMREYIESHLDW